MPGDQGIRDDPPYARHLPHPTGDTAQRQQAEKRRIRGKNEPRFVSRFAPQ
jgi:hypothetical protein